MRNIDIKDYFKIDESHSKIRGFVFAYDQNGNEIFHKENMITKAGRKYIINKGFNTQSITKAVVSSNGEMTNQDFTLENHKSINQNDKYDIAEVKHNEISKEMTCEHANNSLDFKYTMKFNSDSIAKINGAKKDKIEVKSLGLVANDGSEDILFSRVTFPAYTLGPEQQLQFEYYIYF